MIKKREVCKICKSIIAVLCAIAIVMGGTVRVKAATIGTAVSNCVTECGKFLGVATLSVCWDYNDGEYVGSEDHSVLYVPDRNNDSICSFNNFKSNDYSNGWAYVQCTYLVISGDCSIFGELYASCDTYGEYDNHGNIIKTLCTHAIDN